MQWCCWPRHMGHTAVHGPCSDPRFGQEIPALLRFQFAALRRAHVCMRHWCQLPGGSKPDACCDDSGQHRPLDAMEELAPRFLALDLRA